jgi:hypothetical protein
MVFYIVRVPTADNPDGKKSYLAQELVSNHRGGINQLDKWVDDKDKRALKYTTKGRAEQQVNLLTSLCHLYYYGYAIEEVESS